MKIRQIIFVPLVLSLLLAAGATWVLAHGGDISLIHACVKNSNGSIRIVGPNSQCDSNEFPLDWATGTSGSSGSGSVFAFIGQTFDSFPACSALWGITDSCSEGTQVPLPSDGKLTALAIYTWLNTSTTPISFTVLVNNAPTALTVEIPPESLTTQVVKVDIPVQSGDLVTVLIEQANSGEEVRFQGSLEYKAD